MIKRIISLFIILSMIIALNPLTINESNATTKTLNILFIGNSKTYYNNMPAMLSNMLTKANKKNNYKVLVKGSMSLNFHYQYISKNEKKIKKLFNGKKIDYIILNEQTDVQSVPFGETYDSASYYNDKRIYGNLSKDAKNVLKKLFEYKMITKTGTKVILNATWNYSDLNDINIINSNFRDTRKAIQNAGYKNCYIAYSGTAIKKVNNAMKKGLLKKQKLFADKSYPKRHTTQVGSYIEALTIYKAMFQENMKENYGGSISSKEMKNSSNKYIVIDNFKYKGFTYSNTQDFMKRAFNKSSIKNIMQYKNIRNFVNKEITSYI